MHIPEGMLNGTICPVTVAAGTVAMAAVTYFALKSNNKPGVKKFALTAMVIFALQMMNFPVMNGTSGHFLGGTFAAFSLGTPFGAVAMALVVAVQAVLFGDGGITALGANILNMAVIGTVVPGVIISFAEKRGINKLAAASVAAWISIVAASTLCAVEIGISGVVDMTKSITAMSYVHSLIGIAEMAITAVLCYMVSKEQFFGRNAVILSVLTALVSPFANSNPDGLEYVVEKHGIFEAVQPLYTTFLNDYSVSFINNGYFSTVTAAFAGIAVIGAVALIGRKER